MTSLSAPTLLRQSNMLISLMTPAFAVARPLGPRPTSVVGSLCSNPPSSLFHPLPIYRRVTKAVLERAFVPTVEDAATIYAPSTQNTTPTVTPCRTPGEADTDHFQLGPSVLFWANFDNTTFHKRFPTALRSAFRSVTRSPADALYWFYCTLRVVFHTALGAFAMLASGFGGTIPLRNVTRVLLTETPSVIEEAFHVLEQDRAYVRAGLFNPPWDITLLHRQNNPLYLLAKTIGFFAEGLRIMKRRREQNPNTATWLEGDLYPQYYKHTFHYQTDGWVSSGSANVYEMTTETLFIGRQDAMQRLTLTALSDFLGRPGESSVIKQRPNVVELAAGTGRMGTFVRDNWPGINYVISDLSPFYLEAARENMQYWERTAGRKKKTLGSVRYIHAAAEKVPLKDGEADVVFAVYLFHELPHSARREVIKEAARLLKPGGLFVITDAIQMGDRPTRDRTLTAFTNLNEPYFTSYVHEDFGKLVGEGGMFSPIKKELSSVSKVLSFVRT